MTAAETRTKSEVAFSSSIRFDLIPSELLTENIIGDNFKKPDKLKGRGFEPKGFQRDWVKDVEIGGKPMTVNINYSPETNRPVQRPDIPGPIGRTVTSWYAEVYCTAEDKPGDIVFPAELALMDVLGDLFLVTPGRVIEY